MGKDNHIKFAANDLIKGFQSDGDPAFAARVEEVLQSSQSFEQKIKELDKAIEQYPTFQSLSEVLFDLLLVRFLYMEASLLDPDYLESEEWNDMEEKYIDRGTEMLNLFLYLQECKDESIDPDIDDFLQEFLLVEDDSFADEQVMYEPFIENADLVQAEMDEVINAGNALPDDHPVKEIFIPFFLFLMSDVSFEERKNAIQIKADQADLCTAYLCCLDSFYQN